MLLLKSISWIFFGSTTCHRTSIIWIIGASCFFKDWFAKNIASDKNEHKCIIFAKNCRRVSFCIDTSSRSLTSTSSSSSSSLSTYYITSWQIKFQIEDLLTKLQIVVSMSHLPSVEIQFWQAITKIWNAWSYKWLDTASVLRQTYLVPAFNRKNLDQDH